MNLNCSAVVVCRKSFDKTWTTTDDDGISFCMWKITWNSHSVNWKNRLQKRQCDREKEQNRDFPFESNTKIAQNEQIKVTASNGFTCFLVSSRFDEEFEQNRTNKNRLAAIVSIWFIGREEEKKKKKTNESHSNDSVCDRRQLKFCDWIGTHWMTNEIVCFLLHVQSMDCFRLAQEKEKCPFDIETFICENV